MTQTIIPGTATCKVIYDSLNNCMSLTSPTGKFIVFTPTYIGVSKMTIDFFGNCEAAYLLKKHGLDFQEFTAVLPLQVMRDCLRLANGKTDTVEIAQVA
jgi:hypothetical protein